MEEFFAKYDTTIFALSGVILGALITGAIDYFSKTKETKLRLTEKLLDKKLQAHEHLITVSNQIRTMVLLGGPDADGELKRTPYIMETQKNMEGFMVQYTTMQIEADRWLPSKLKREMSLFLDYFVNLREFCRNAENENLQEAGAIIRNDFIDFSTRLENVAHEYFNNDLMRLNIKTDRNWHKYPREQTLEELDKTIFFTRKQEIYNVLHKNT